MNKEIYVEVLQEEPKVGVKTKKYKAWEKRLHNSIGWIEPLIKGEVIAEKDKNGVLKPVSSVMDDKVVWDVNIDGEGKMTFDSQENAEIMSCLVQLLKRVERLEKTVKDK